MVLESKKGEVILVQGLDKTGSIPYVFFQSYYTLINRGILSIF